MWGLISAPFREKEELYLIQEEKVIILTKMYVCSALRDLVLVVQFKKNVENPQEGVLLLVKIAG